MIPIKSAREIEKMRTACRTASDVLERVSELIRPGVTTKEIDQAAADFMAEAGVRSAFLGIGWGIGYSRATSASHSMTKSFTASAVSAASSTAIS